MKYINVIFSLLLVFIYSTLTIAISDDPDCDEDVTIAPHKISDAEHKKINGSSKLKKVINFVLKITNVTEKIVNLEDEQEFIAVINGSSKFKKLVIFLLGLTTTIEAENKFHHNETTNEEKREDIFKIEPDGSSTIKKVLDDSHVYNQKGKNFLQILANFTKNHEVYYSSLTNAWEDSNITAYQSEIHKTLDEIRKMYRKMSTNIHSVCSNNKVFYNQMTNKKETSIGSQVKLLKAMVEVTSYRMSSAFGKSLETMQKMSNLSKILKDVQNRIDEIEGKVSKNTWYEYEWFDSVFYQLTDLLTDEKKLIVTLQGSAEFGKLVLDNFEKQNKEKIMSYSYVIASVFREMSDVCSNIVNRG